MGHDSRCIYMVLKNIQLNAFICVATHITDHIILLEISYQQIHVVISQ